MTSYDRPFTRLRPLLPVSILAYAGATLIFMPYFSHTAFAEILSDLGTLMLVAAIVMFSSSRLEHRIDNIVATQSRLVEAGIEETGAIDRQRLDEPLRRFEYRAITIVVNSRDLRLLADVVRFTDDRGQRPRRILVAEWPREQPPSPEQLTHFTWVRDMSRGGELRVTEKAATTAAITSETHSLAFFAIDRDRGLYLFSLFARASRAGDLLSEGVERLWKDAAIYEEPKPVPHQ